jgi:hypothetical protein
MHQNAASTSRRRLLARHGVETRQKETNHDRQRSFCRRPGTHEVAFACFVFAVTPPSPEDRENLDRDCRTPAIAGFGAVHRFFSIDVTPAASGSS